MRNIAFSASTKIHLAMRHSGTKWNFQLSWIFLRNSHLNRPSRFCPQAAVASHSADLGWSARDCVGISGIFNTCDFSRKEPVLGWLDCWACLGAARAFGFDTSLPVVVSLTSPDWYWLAMQNAKSEIPSWTWALQKRLLKQLGCIGTGPVCPIFFTSGSTTLRPCTRSTNWLRTPDSIPMTSRGAENRRFRV